MITAELRLAPSRAPSPSPSSSPEPGATPADVGPRRRFRVAPALALLALLLTSSAGCSLIFVDGPPTQHRTLPYFDCTSSNIAPVADFIIAGSEGLAAVGSYRDVGSSGSNGESLVGAAIVAAGFLASGIVGMHRTSDCREAKAQLMVRAAENSRHGAALAPPTNIDPWLAPGPPAANGWPAPAAPPPGAPTSPPGAIAAPPPAAGPATAVPPPPAPTHPTPDPATDDEDPRPGPRSPH